MVYLFLADGFEEIEALTPVDLLRRAGVVVITVSVMKGKTVLGSHGIPVSADALISDISEPAEMLILPGGMPGAEHLGNCKRLRELLIDADSRGAFIASICAAPSVVGKLGLLRGKRAICFPGFEKYLEGAKLSGDKVVRDGNYITGAGMGVSIEFSLALVEALKDKAAASELAERILFKR